MGADRWNVRFFFQAEDGIRDLTVTGVQTCALPIHPPTATLAITAAAASQRGGTARARAGRGCAAGALRRSALIRASICGHRSRGGSIAGDSSRSELTLRSSALPVPLMSAHLHIQSLAQEFPRAVQLGLARALRYTH